jgi:hypothetical protein
MDFLNKISNTQIIIFTGLVGFYISWKIYNIFVSLGDAVNMSTFSYYMKKFGAAATTSGAFMFITAMYLYKDVPSNKYPPQQVEQTQTQSENKVEESATATTPAIEKPQENTNPTTQNESSVTPVTQEAEKEKQ